MRRFLRLLSCCAPLISAVSAFSAPTAPADPFAASVRPFLQAHCVDCHGADEPKGGIRLENLSSDITKRDVAAVWVDVFDQISTGAMPPKRKPRPPVDASTKVQTTLKSALVANDLARRNADQGRVILRRLNRNEYQNTIQDLLGIETEVKDILPEDTSSMGFDNIAAALNVSSVLMERYLEAADAALDAVMPPAGPKPERKTVTATYGHETNNPADYRWKTGVEVLPDSKAFVLYNSGDTPINADRARVKVPGRYHFKIKGFAYRSQEPITVKLMAGPFDFKGSRNDVMGFYDLAPDANKPTVIEFTRLMPKGGTIKIAPFGLGRRGIDTPEKVKEYTGPGAAVLSVEVDGPINDAWPSEGYTKLFGAVDLKAGKIADAETILKKFVPRAYRRPVKDAEMTPLLELVKAQLGQGETFETAIRAALKAVLCSPEFLFLKETPGKLDDYAIASRLSYFLWSTMPDDALFQAASGKLLSQPAALRQQTDRMLASPRAQEFTENFCGQWLGLRQIDATQPDRRTYNKFDESIQWSMVQETQRFFGTLMNENLNVANLIDSDFLVINAPLAKLYNIDGVKGIDFRKVKTPADSHRGGLLGQAAVLKVTANGTSTSPVVRGAWVMRNIIGRPPKPPPPNVPAIEPDTRGATTIREILAKHRNETACAACHAKIDPPGLAMESFDVIGGWRENYKTFGGGLQSDDRNLNGKSKGKPYPTIDTTGEWPGGKAFQNYDEFKKILLADKEQVTRCLTEKLLTYATGTGLDFADRDSVDAILKNLHAKNDGLRTLVHEVVQSEVFRQK